jgi:hypothetical protein
MRVKALTPARRPRISRGAFMGFSLQLAADPPPRKEKM